MLMPEFTTVFWMQIWQEFLHMKQSDTQRKLTLLKAVL